MPSNRVFLSLGSNIRPEHYLPAVVRELRKTETVLATSSVWESLPVGDKNQANFLNAAVLIETERPANELHEQLIAPIENRLHRTRDPQNINAARTIDIDLSLFNHEQFQLAHRQIPDPDILSRNFVAVPLAELDPHYVHPVTQKTLQEIADSLTKETATAAALKIRPDIQL